MDDTTLDQLEAALRAGHDRFVSTSTTSLMISQAIRDEDVAELSFDGGLNGAIKAAIALLEATFGEGGDAARPPQPPA